jgi:hypothetical protein
MSTLPNVRWEYVGLNISGQMSRTSVVKGKAKYRCSNSGHCFISADISLFQRTFLFCWGFIFPYALFHQRWIQEKSQWISNEMDKSSLCIYEGQADISLFQWIFHVAGDISLLQWIFLCASEYFFISADISVLLRIYFSSYIVLSKMNTRKVWMNFKWNGQT